MTKNYSTEEQIYLICTSIKIGELTANDATDKIMHLFNASRWVNYDWNKIETRPPKYGKYFIKRKDGKVHWETWNGMGWAYNGNVIIQWQEIK